MLLSQEYKTDPNMLSFYERNLLTPGWAGQLADNEAAYIAESLCSDRELWRTWRKALTRAKYLGKRRNKPSAYVVKGWSDFLDGVLNTVPDAS